MKRIFPIFIFVVSISSAWGETVTRSLPSSFVPPPPPNQSEIQNMGSLQFLAFQNNMFAPLFAKKKAEEKDKELAASKAADPARHLEKNSHNSLLPKSYESSIHGLQFVEPSQLHSQ